MLRSRSMVCLSTILVISARPSSSGSGRFSNSEIWNKSLTSSDISRLWLQWHYDSSESGPHSLLSWNTLMSRSTVFLSTISAIRARPSSSGPGRFSNSEIWNKSLTSSDISRLWLQWHYDSSESGPHSLWCSWSSFLCLPCRSDKGC